MGGRAAAKKQGVKFGPKPKLAPHLRCEAVRMVREGQNLRAVAHHDTIIVRALEPIGNPNQLHMVKGEQCHHSAAVMAQDDCVATTKE
jgi:hypothetical protein